MLPHHIRVLEDNLNVLSGTIVRQFALMLELDRKATEIGAQLDALRGPYLSTTRQQAIPVDSAPSVMVGFTSPSSVSHRVSPSSKRGASGRRQTRRSQTPTGRTPRSGTSQIGNKGSENQSDRALDRIAELQQLQDRLWTEKLLVGKQCLSTIENAVTSVSDASHNISQQLIATASAVGEYNSATFSTTSAGTHRTSMRTAALIASQAMHQSLVETGNTAWRGGDTGGSSVVSRTRKRQSS